MGFDKYLTADSDECSIATNANDRVDGLVQLHICLSTRTFSTIVGMIAFVYGMVLNKALARQSADTKPRVYQPRPK